jgi:hypothetical protein
METPASESQCCSIKSKKNANLRCPNVASRGEFCAKHCNSRVLWSSTSKAAETNTNVNANAKAKNKTKPKPIPFTKRQKASAEIINKFWKVYGRLALRRRHGPTLFLPSLSHNDRDIYTFDTISTIPMAYHFSFIDEKHHAWTFDMRFLIQLLQYGKKLINPFSQEPISETTIHRLDAMSQNLRKHKLPIVYVHTDELTPEQIWNQKVLDVFLKLTSLGYGVNMLWFETMTVSAHRTFYRKLYDLWNITAGLTPEDKEDLDSIIEDKFMNNLKWSMLFFVFNNISSSDNISISINLFISIFKLFSKIEHIFSIISEVNICLSSSIFVS